MRVSLENLCKNYWMYPICRRLKNEFVSGVGLTAILMAWLVCNVLLVSAQKSDASIDVQHYQFGIAINDLNDSIKGNAQIDLRMLKEAETIDFDLAVPNAYGKGMHVISAEADGQAVSFTRSGDKITIRVTRIAQRGQQINIHFRYEGIPSDGLIISTSKFNRRTFFGDNWPNRAHYWLPCVDHPADKASVDFIILAPDHYQIISNGIKIEETNLPDHQRETHYRETVPLPTKVMVFGAADFAVQESGEVDCIPVYSWVYPENKDMGFSDYGQAKEILSYFIQKVGPYPYRKLANVQSKTRFGGMENASAIFYSENSVQGDRRVESLLAHEIAHQWFGNSATEKDWPDLWLSEGFATYMTHLYLENRYGPDTLLKRMKEDREKVISFSRVKNSPVVDTTEKDNLMKMLNANSYQKGGWVLHMLRLKLGQELFWKGIQHYYARFAGKNASTRDFQDQMEKVSGQDLSQFFHQWLFTEGHPILKIQWKYLAATRKVEGTILQMQKKPFSFPLQLSVTEGNTSRVETKVVSGKTTSFTFEAGEKPSGFLVDPLTHLLFEGTVTELP